MALEKALRQQHKPGERSLSIDQVPPHSECDSERLTQIVDSPSAVEMALVSPKEGDIASENSPWLILRRRGEKDSDFPNMRARAENIGA
jgi:hypothetical protein